MKTPYRRAPRSGPVPRWEWRTFAPRGLARFVAHLPSTEVERESAETYFVSASSPGNVKVRDHRVEVKERIESGVNGLELWRPVLVAAFPLPAAVVRRLAAAWGLPRSSVRGGCESERALVELAARLPGVVAVAVEKRRRRVEVNECRGEYVALSIMGEPWESLAFEAADPAAVRGAIRLLGLDRLPATNYPAALMHIAGMSATRAGSPEQE